MSTMRTGLRKDERPIVRQTYSVEEVAKLLGIGRNSAYEAARRGDFPTIKVGGRIVVPKSALDRMLNGEVV
jgi:excisionase family DNA binding protein